jgi:hypothetical protein
MVPVVRLPGVSARGETLADGSLTSVPFAAGRLLISIVRAFVRIVAVGSTAGGLGYRKHRMRT